MPYERNEGARAVIFVCVAFLCPDDTNQSLGFALFADRNDESPVQFQLREQRLRHIGAARRYKNRIVRSMRAPAQSAVETFDGRVVDAKPSDARLSFARQFAYTLDGINLRREPRQHSRLVT